MPYGNYSYVIDSSFRPFSMQEMLVPFAMYKDEFEKQEAMLDELSKNTDTFKYLEQVAKDNPDSKAAQIYNTYASDLRKYGDDFSANGLSMANSRGLRNMKRRYQGEIGRLVKAQTRLDEEMKLRRQLSANDPSILYGTEILNIDNFLDNATPNLYSISGNDLYARGAAAGKAASARIYSDPQVRALDKYYNEYFSTEGYSPEKMQEFRNNLAAIPELQKAAMDIIKANRVGELGEGSANYNAALQQIINGIADGAIYQRQSSMQRNLGQMTAAERAQLEDNRDARALSAAMYGYKKVNGKWVRDSNATPVKGSRSSGSVSSSAKGRSSTNKYAQLSKGVRVVWDDDPTAKDATYTSTDLDSSPSVEFEHMGRAITYDELPQYAKDRVDAELGPEGNVDLHRYYFSPYVSGDWNDDEAVLEIFPYDVTTYNGEATSMEDDTDLKGGK